MKKGKTFYIWQGGKMKNGILHVNSNKYILCFPSSHAPPPPPRTHPPPPPAKKKRKTEQCTHKLFTGVSCLPSQRSFMRKTYNLHAMPIPHSCNISLVSTYVVCERLSVMHKQVSVQLTSNSKIFVQILQKAPFWNFRPESPPPPPMKNFRFEMTKVYSGIPPSPVKTSDLR